MSKKYCDVCGKDLTNIPRRWKVCSDTCESVKANEKRKMTDQPHTGRHSNSAARAEAFKDMPINSEKYFIKSKLIREILSINDRVCFGLLEDLSMLHLKHNST